MTEHEPLLRSTMRDLVVSARMLIRSRGFTAAAVLTLALGIAANTTIFSFVYAMVLRPLPLKDLPRLVSIYGTDQRNPGERGISRQNYLDLRERNDTFEQLTAEGWAAVSLAAGTGEAERVTAGLVAGNYFSTLGVAPTIGRGFAPDEDRAEGGPQVAVMSHALWQQRFGANPSIVGQTIAVNNRPFTVIGVMPADFVGTQTVVKADLWLPLMTYPVATTGPLLQGQRSRRFDWLTVTGRLKPGTDARRAEANLKSIARALESEYPNDNGGRTVGIRPLGQLAPSERQSVVTAVALLMTLAGIVLLIACTNVANLIFARASERQREMAIRQALGASRARLIRQLLTEYLLLAIASGAVGLVLSLWGQRALWAYRPAGYGADDLDLSLNGPVLAFTVAESLLTCLLFGALPALRAARPDLINELKGRTTAGRARRHVRRLLIASQVALSAVALTYDGLFIRSLQNLQQVDLGFDVDHVGVLRFELGTQGYAEPQGREFQRDVLERASAIPGVHTAVLADFVPLFSVPLTRTIFTIGEENGNRSGRLVPTAIVGPQYFTTLGIQLVRGRVFNDLDQPSSVPVALVNDRLAAQLWPGEDPLGKQIRLINTPAYEVVGVVRGVKSSSVDGDAPPMLYRALTQVYAPDVALLVRANDPGAALGPVRLVIQQLNPRLPVTDVSSLANFLARSLWRQRAAAQLLGLFGAISLALALIGIYGVMAYSVSQRTQELGIRIAIGANPTAVRRMVLSEGLRLCLIGLGLGLGVALAAMPLVQRLLYGSVVDAVSLGILSAVILLAVAAASVVPANRAARTNPVVALRTENG